jgi:rod shape-determining protein MreB
MFSYLMGLLSNDVAIDLGTANTLVYVQGKGIVLNEPSVVAVEKATGKVIAVGHAAKAMLGRTPDKIEAVRPLRDGVIADFEKTEDLLSSFIQRCSGSSSCPRVIICVLRHHRGREIARFGRARRSARSAALAETSRRRSGSTPMAKPTGNMVIDIGGGTTEIAVMALNDIVHHESIRVGGDEMDEAIVLYLKKAYNMLIGDKTAELIKLKIGSAFKLGEEEELEIKGRDLIAGIPRTMKISSVEVREALQESTNAIVDAVKRSLERTPPELASDIVDKGIVMTGGGSLLRGIDALLREHTNLPVTVAEDPLLCVVLGTGKILEDLETYEKVVMNTTED